MATKKMSLKKPFAPMRKELSKKDQIKGVHIVWSEDVPQLFVRIGGDNGEKLSNTETLKSKNNCFKNIIAQHAQLDALFKRKTHLTDEKGHHWVWSKKEGKFVNSTQHLRTALMPVLKGALGQIDKSKGKKASKKIISAAKDQFAREH